MSVQSLNGDSGYQGAQVGANVQSQVRRPGPPEQGQAGSHLASVCCVTQHSVLVVVQRNKEGRFLCARMAWGQTVTSLKETHVRVLTLACNGT